jgi:hypothetical protein
MNSSVPDLLTQGDPARLFPVLADTSKEGRATSILLTCISIIDELGGELLKGTGQRVGRLNHIQKSYLQSDLPKKRIGLMA